jgi:biotin-dependent carboxylase-like uncharacterized protein
MIKVLKAGFYTTIQDQGRIGFAAIGLPISGAMDLYSSNLANSILNNSFEEAVLEITFGVCQFQFLSKTSICISGGDFSPTINQLPVVLNSKILVNEKDILSFGKINFGARCYLAVKGGFLTEKKLFSRSYFKNITSSFLIQTGELLPISLASRELKVANTAVKMNPSHFNSEIIECYKGPEFELLSIQQQYLLFETIFSISNDNNRMGYKLNETITNNIPSILTSAVLPGTVQLTPSGKLIVLMRDCQVTGGYPRVLQLSANAINKLAQKKTGSKFSFTSINI